MCTEIKSNAHIGVEIKINAHIHCRQRALVENVLSSSGTSQLGMFDIQAMTKRKYYGHIIIS